MATEMTTVVVGDRGDFNSGGRRYLSNFVVSNDVIF